MKRRPIASLATPPTLALGGKIATIAAERFPTADAPMSQSDRAAFWLGEYLNARQMLPHLKASELLGVINEHDEQACGPTFLRTIKRLAQEHLNSSKAESVAAARSRSRRVAPPGVSSVEALTPASTAPPSSVSPTPNGAADDELHSLDIQARLNRIRASAPQEEQS